MDFRPQKEDPGDKIQYDSELSVRSADITTAKLLWNSVISTEDAKYMCLDISLFYLTAHLEYYEYMKMPLHLFPQWIIDQYDLNKHAVNRMVQSKCAKRYTVYPKQEYLPTNDYAAN
jgi:hypothetical protein